MATHRNFALAGKTAVILLPLKQRGGESSRNLSSLWEIKVSFFTVLYLTEVVEIKKIYSITNREALMIILARKLYP